MSEEAKTQTQSGADRLQSAESKREALKIETRQIIRGIREGHTTGGYCDSAKLKEAEKVLFKILDSELKSLKEKHGYSPDPKLKHPAIRACELELNGLSWKPELVVKD